MTDMTKSCVYICIYHFGIATNIIIICLHLITGRPSLFLLQPPLLNIELTETVTMGCFALGYNVSYQWFIGSGSFSSKVTGINNNTLVIPDVRLSDDNTYTCVATTLKGCILSNATQLTVTGMIIVYK